MPVFAHMRIFGAVKGAYMTSVMIWSVESVLLGLWALVLASYSTPLHVFVARSHVLISVFNLLLHLYVKARDLAVASAVSQAFICAVMALFMGYLAILFENDSQSNPLFFKTPMIGLMTLEAYVGLAWFVVAIINGIGMALGSIEKLDSATRLGRTHQTFLMFHPFGFHLVAVLPCLLLVSVSGSVKASSLLVELSFSQSVYITVCLLTWILYAMCMGILIFRRGSDGQLITQQSFFEINSLLSVFTGCYPVLVTLIVLLFTDLSFQQCILVLCILGVSILLSLPNNLGVLTRLPVIGPYIPNIPTIDKFFSKQYEEGEEDGSDRKNSRIVLNNPSVNGLLPVRDASNGVTKDIGAHFPSAPSRHSSQRFNLVSAAALPPLVDPAAVPMNRRQIAIDRMKMV